VAPERVLLTGATGAFGRYLLRELAGAGRQVSVVVRAGDPEAATSRVAAALAGPVPGGVDVICGDLARPDLGLTAGDRRRLQASTTAVLHAAASTRFDLALARARAANVGTLRNVLAFAASAPSLTRFGFVSTAFVAGQTGGRILETPPAGAPPVTTYDASKAEAEVLVRSGLLGVAVDVYRPSLVVAGDASGRHAALAVLRLVQAGLMPALPGDPRDRFDVVPAPEAAGVVVALFSDPRAAGGTYHVAAGDAAPRVGDLIALALPAGRRITYTGPGLEAWEAAVRRLCQVRPGCTPVYRRVGSIAAYLANPRCFDTTSLRRVLGAAAELPSALPVIAGALGRLRSAAA